MSRLALLLQLETGKRRLDESRAKEKGASSRPRGANQKRAQAQLGAQKRNSHSTNAFDGPGTFAWER